MKETTSRSDLKLGIIPLLCAAFVACGDLFPLFAADNSSPAPITTAGLFPVLAADNWSPSTGQKPDADATSVGAGAEGAKVSESEGDLIAQASVSPTPPADNQTPDSGDEATPPMPAPDATTPPADNETPSQDNQTPPAEVETPLPGAAGTEAAANAVPLAENPALEQQFSEWDLAQVESPLFLNSAIDEFNERPLLITGNWSVKPHLSIGTYYDGNIFLRSADNANSDFITRVAPGLSMRLGDTDSIFYLMADYTTGFNYYVEHPSESTIDQEGRAQFQWSLPKTTFGLSLNASSNTGQDIDVTNRVRQELYFAGLTAHYDFGEKTSWDISTDYTRSDYNGLISSSQEEAQLFFNYQYSPKTQLGIGGGAGALSVPGNPEQIFEEANLRATYRATGKITLIAETGLDLRQFGGGGGSSLTPIFILEGAWAPRNGTTVSLTARRSIYASAILNDQDYTATSLDFSVRQRITDYVDVSLAGGYVNTEYTSTASNVSATRQDNYYYVRPAVEWKALSWLSVGIFYEYSRDISTGGDANSFARDRGGVDLAILF